MSEPFYDSDLWRRVRYFALKRAAGCCQCCGTRARKDKPLHVDHIKPRSKFPALALDPENLQVLCGDCNLGKGAWDSTDWRPNQPRKRVHRLKPGTGDQAGEPCPKCDQLMNRVSHRPGWKPRTDRAYYLYWDRCIPCGHIQHYHSAKVVSVGPDENPIEPVKACERKTDEAPGTYR